MVPRGQAHPIGPGISAIHLTLGGRTIGFDPSQRAPVKGPAALGGTGTDKFGGQQAARTARGRLHRPPHRQGCPTKLCKSETL